MSSLDAGLRLSNEVNRSTLKPVIDVSSKPLCNEDHSQIQSTCSVCGYINETELFVESRPFIF